LPFAQTNTPGKSTALSCDGAVPNPDRADVIEAAAGERIVAFARRASRQDSRF